MIGILGVLLAAAPTHAAACDPASLKPGLEAALSAAQRKDYTKAKSGLAAAVACPVTDGVTYQAHVARANIAAEEQDWATAHVVMNDVEVHPESLLSPTAEFIRLQADQAVGDTAAFIRDRSRVLNINDTILTKIGKRVEVIKHDKMLIAAYQAELDQGVLHRSFEFIIMPDDPMAMPMSIMFTRDKNVDEIVSKDSNPASRLIQSWFVDLYTCKSHATLEIIPALNGTVLTYDVAKDHVLKALKNNDSGTSSITAKSASCFGGRWMLPGLGLRPFPPE